MFADKLKSLRKTKGITQEQLANVLGVTQQAVGRYEKGLNMPDNNILLKIADYFHVSLDSLQGRNIGLYEINERKHIPVIGSVRCGAGGLAYELIDEYISIDDTYRADEMRGFRAVGDSMEAEIHEGDICLVHLQEEVPDGAIAVVVIDGEEGTMKRVHHTAGAVVLQSINPNYPPRVFTGADVSRVHIVGRVVEVRHKTI